MTLSKLTDYELEAIIADSAKEWIFRNQNAVKIILYDGTVVSLLGFKPTDFNPEHCFNILPNINRYNGNTYIQFSVGQHSLLCYEIAKALFATPEDEFLCLIHDFQESLVGDCISPIKHLPILSGFRIVEDHLEECIRENLGISSYWNTHSATRVNLVDKLALSIEVHNLNKYYHLDIWGSYIFPMYDVKRIFGDYGAEYSYSLIGDILGYQPRQVEVRLRNVFNNLHQKLK